MANDIIPPSPAEINGQDNSQVLVTIGKLRAMLEVGLECDLKACSNTTIHNYLWQLSDLTWQLEESLT